MSHVLGVVRDQSKTIDLSCCTDDDIKVLDEIPFGL